MRGTLLAYVRKRIGQRRASLTGLGPTLALAALLAIYGNLVSLSPEEARQRFDWAYILGNLALMAALLFWARRWGGLSLAAIGLSRQRLLRSALQGGALAALVSVPVVLFFAFPLVVEEPIRYEAAEEMSVGGFLLWALLKEPVGTALFEEVAFRGLLQARAVAALSLRRGIAATALAFALWHLVINYRTIQETNVADSPALAALAQVGSLAGLFLGGLFLSLLRHHTGNLAGPIVFHWLMVVAMTGALFVLAR